LQRARQSSIVTRMRCPLVLLVLVLATRFAAADGDAERLYKDGQAAYDAKRYADAIVAWDKAYALSKLPALVFNLAQAHRLAGNCRPAYDAYKNFVTLDPAAEDRPAAEQFIRELESCALAKPKPVPKPVTGKPRYEDHGRGLRLGGLAIGGGGLVLLATGVYFGNQASSIASEIKKACESSCEWAVLESRDAEGKRAETLQYVFLSMSAATIATGAWLYVRGTRKREVLVEPKAGGAIVKVGGRF
jgi:tetratricopeptide (TPR) repeat protein